MAFGLSERFPPIPPYNRILDPGAYQKISSSVTKINKVPFLSNTPRRTGPGNKLWTHAMYSVSTPTKNLNSLVYKSKSPRFSYESLTKEDIENLLCQCGIQSICECSTDEQEDGDADTFCQGKVRRRIFKGPTLNLPRKPKKYVKNDMQPPFYNTRVKESSSYYQGCKWSQRTSQRPIIFLPSGPGPADYTIVKAPYQEISCDEKVRAHKRKTSKQLRYIDMVQQRSMRDSFPGPGSYDPKELKGTDLSYLGPKSARFFVRKYNQHPGPADHWIKRCFDPTESPDKYCRVNIIGLAPFGSRAARLKYKRDIGPSPASYNSKLSTCQYTQFSKAPFGVSSVRFKQTIEEDDEIDNNYLSIEDGKNEKEVDKPCLLPTWEFRSQTIRMKPLQKKINEPSPADLPESNNKTIRTLQLQNIAPFFSSEDRFQPWHNWISVYGSENTPGPGYYCLDIPKCVPAVHRGPMNRSPRFPKLFSQVPSPNHYTIGSGIETVLATHNERLKCNLNMRHKFCWKPKKETRNQSYKEQEKNLLNRSIEMLNVYV